MVVGMFCSAALAIAPMGPPIATLEQGKYGAGIAYAFSDMTLEVSGPLTGLPGGEAVINDLQHNIYMGLLGYGISNDWDLYGGIGWANAEFPGDTGAPDFEGDDGFIFGIGTKRTLAEDGDTKWGVLAQFTQGKSEDDVRTTGSGQTWGNGAGTLPAPISPATSRKFEAKLEWYEVQLALGPAVPLSEDMVVYGGPFLHFVEADLEVKGSRYEYELEQKWQLGAYVGTLISLGDPNASLMAEFLYTANGWGFGVGALFACP